MTQIATVVSVKENKAHIVVARHSACAHDCSKCGGCGQTEQPVYCDAENLVGAKDGDKVVVESETKDILKAAAFVYIVPVVLFFIGAIGLRTILGESLSYLIGGLGFAIGLVVAVLYDKKLNKSGGVSFRITRVL